MKKLLVATLLAVSLSFGFTAAARELRVTEEEVYCLALNDYYEARGEPIQGRVAVAYVVLNRVSKTNTTICETVTLTNGRHCAFSWACDRYPIREEVSWRESLGFATKFLRTYKQIQDPTSGAVHYHEQSILPYWAKDYEFNVVIGDHVFYPRQIAKKGN